MRQDELNYTDREILLSAGFEEDIPDRTLTAILKALKDKKPIEAIKLYREVTGSGLRDAKNAIDTARYALAVKEKKDCAEELGVAFEGAGAVVTARKGNKLAVGFLVLLLSAAVGYGIFTFL